MTRRAQITLRKRRPRRADLRPLTAPLSNDDLGSMRVRGGAKCRRWLAGPPVGAPVSPVTRPLAARRGVTGTELVCVIDDLLAHPIDVDRAL
jgi:hypothetical protein